MHRAPPLTGALSQIEAIAGREVALAVAEKVGGTRLYVPSPGRVDPDCAIAQLVGAEAAARIAAAIGPAHLPIAQNKRALAHALREQALPLPEIARRLRVSTRTLCRWHAATRRAPADGAPGAGDRPNATRRTVVALVAAMRRSVERETSRRAEIVRRCADLLDREADRIARSLPELPA